MFQSEPAALVIFRSQFFHSNASGTNRFKSAIIRLSFTDSSSQKDLTKAPRILKIFPTHAKAVCESARTVKNEVGVGVQPSIGGLNVGIPLFHSARTSTSTRKRYGEINGIITTTKQRYPRADNRALWMIDEDDIARDGIPRIFGGAVILRHGEQPFQMAIDVETRQGFLSDSVELLRKAAREADDLVKFIPGAGYSIEKKQIPIVFDDLVFDGLVDTLPDMKIDGHLNN
ncbi:hypothetical protein FQN49_005142 [Arthroderma sp. PD_2]|nr:hypothetical protein FQN49_005142 [Arthroderma sp. PD_2]